MYLFYKEIIFLKVIYILGLSIFSTLDPFFRFDGYWLASDISGIPNLRSKAFDVLKEKIKASLGKKNKVNLNFLRLKPRARIFLYVYAIISNFFFAIILLYFILSLPELIRVYPREIENFFNRIYQLTSNFDLNPIWNSLSSLVFPTALLLMGIKVLLSWIRKFQNNIFSNNSQSRQNKI